MSPRRLLSALGLAAACAGAAACNEVATPPVGRDSVADSLMAAADQVMFGINTVLTNDGLLRARLSADTALFFDQNSRIELRNVRVTFYDATGRQNSVLTSREGTYNTRLEETEARRDVIVVSNDGRRLTTPQLKYSQVRNEISSDSAFVLTEPNRRLEGIGFTSDPDMRNVQVDTVRPGTQGTFTLPGQ
jgi:LPS export ABC transporter protein LptC